VDTGDGRDGAVHVVRRDGHMVHLGQLCDAPEIDQATSSTWHTPETDLPPDTYYWCVLASNACGAGPWSSPAWSFTITAEPDTSPPAAVTDLAGGSLGSRRVLLRSEVRDAAAGGRERRSVNYRVAPVAPGQLFSSIQ
jgi:hypothetical protein